MSRPVDPAPIGDALLETAASWQLRLSEDPGARPAFEAWRDASPAHRAAFEQVGRGWNLFGDDAGPALRVAATEARTAAEAARRRRRFRQGAGAFSAIAASLLLALFVWPGSRAHAPRSS